MKTKTLKTAFTLELSSLLSSMRPYIYFGAVTLIAFIYTAYFNLYGGSPELQYTLRYIPLPVMLAAPLITVGAFAGYRDRDRMLISLGADNASLLLGRLLAIWTIGVSPIVPMLILPPVIGSLGRISYSGAYLGLLSAALFCIAYCTALTLISAVCRSKRLCYAISYALFIVTYLGDMAHAALPQKTLPMIAAALVISAAFSAAIYGFTRSLTASITVFSVLTVIFCAVCNLFKGLAYGVIRTLLSFLIPSASLGELLYGGIFDIRYLLFLLLYTALCAFTAYICLEGRRQK